MLTVHACARAFPRGCGLLALVLRALLVKNAQKYIAHLSADERSLVEEANALDMELYAW